MRFNHSNLVWTLFAGRSVSSSFSGASRTPFALFSSSFWPSSSPRLYHGQRFNSRIRSFTSTSSTTSCSSSTTTCSYTHAFACPPVIPNHGRSIYSSWRSSTRLMSGSSNPPPIMRPALEMENVYLEWTVEDDQYLYQNMNENIPKLASVLGRGLKGVESRIAKLKDVDSFAYQRLFRGNTKLDAKTDKNPKLTPVGEVMRRIKWDSALNPDDFTVEYFDRVQEQIMSVAFGTKNESVQGKEEMFVFAIPEHRIRSIKYKERVVWDKNQRMDCVFGSMNGNGETIDKVVESYNEWKKRQDEIKEYNHQRQQETAAQVKQVLGEHLFAALKSCSSELQNKSRIKTVDERDIHEYVQDAISFFRKARASASEDTRSSSSSSSSSSISSTVKNDAEALYLFSNLVALLPDENLREQILLEIYKHVNHLEPSTFATTATAAASPLPDLNEDELIESFVRGSGAGGQKINKTANKVLLIHEPTQLRVECQDTRSLQQNRKIARKRLKLKLDEYLNGPQSVTQQKIIEKIQKKQKVKAKNKARLRKKKDAQEAVSRMDDVDDERFKL